MMSMRPSVACTLATQACTAAWSLTSTAISIAASFLPCESSATAALRRASSRAQIATRHPSSINRFAVALPMPLEPPTIKATLPRNPRSIPRLIFFVVLGFATLWCGLDASSRQKGTEMGLGIKGRRAIVTGGGSGIGYEPARLFLQEGVRVLIAGRTADTINKARDEL